MQPFYGSLNHISEKREGNSPYFPLFNANIRPLLTVATDRRASEISSGSEFNVQRIETVPLDSKELYLQYTFNITSKYQSLAAANSMHNASKLSR